MKPSIKLGTLIGIPIEINYSWLIVFVLVTWTLAVKFFPVYNPFLPASQYWIASTAAALLFFISLLLHELSHSYVAMKHNIPIKKITLFIFGGVAHMGKEPDTSGAEFKMAIAGPLCSLFIAVISFAAANILSIYKINPLFSGVFNYLAVMNIFIVIFNSIPGFPLDGGRVLRATIWHFNKDLKSATRIAASLGKFFSFIFMMIGLACLFTSQVITGIWYLIIGLFLHDAADLSYQQLILKKALVGVPVKDIMATNLITVSPDLALDKLVNGYFLKHRHMGFPVVNNGVLEGIVTLHNLKDIPRERWPSTKTSAAMTGVREDLLVGPNTDSLEALLQVTKSGLGRLLVVERGRLLGIVTQRNLVQLFEIKTRLGA